MSQHAEVTGSGRGTLLLIVGIPLAMILGASLLWYLVARGDMDLVAALGTANNGDLVTPPRGLQDLGLVDDNGIAFRWDDVEPRWTLIVPAAGDACDAACERRIWFTRQIHVALGKDFNRIRRAVITDYPAAEMAVERGPVDPEGWPAGFDSGSVLEYLALGHPGVLALQAQKQDFASLFDESALKDGVEWQGGWYLADPAGWIMMRYEDGLDYKAVIADLKFLLKNSGGG